MKVLIIGGAGKIGAKVAIGMAKLQGVLNILIADINLEAAKRLANKIGSKATAIRFDANDSLGVIKSMREADLVMNMIGPGSKYAVPLLKAALEARRNFVDINDDEEPLPELLALDYFAKDAGLTMLTGAGVSPGTTNLLARYGADKLELVYEIRILWVCNMTPLPTMANWRHRLNMYKEKVTIFDGGRYMHVPGGSGAEETQWPLPVGRLVVRFCGHPEPLTLPRYIKKGLKHVSCKGGLTPPEHNELIMHIKDLGLASSNPVKVGDVSIAPVNFMQNFLMSDVFKSTDFYKDLINRENAIGPNLGLRIELQGLKDSKVTRIIYEIFGPERNTATAIPAWIMGGMILNRSIQMRGVMCPEDLGIDPHPIIDEYVNAGGTYKETLL